MKDLFEFIGGIFTWLIFAVIKAVLLAPIVALAYYVFMYLIGSSLPYIGTTLFGVVAIGYIGIVLSSVD